MPNSPYMTVFAVMWFSQSKEDNEGDWALNTSQAAVDAWKAGIAKMKALDNTALKPAGRASNSSFRLQDGKLYMQTGKALKASVVQFDYQGRVLWQSPVQHFSAGVHAIDAPKASTQSLFKLSIKR